MYQLIRLGNCIHVFDKQNKKYVKSTFINIKKATLILNPQTTRKEALKNIQWVPCSDPNCRVQKCKQTGHWIARSIG